MGGLRLGTETIYLNLGTDFFIGSMFRGCHWMLLFLHFSICQMGPQDCLEGVYGTLNMYLVTSQAAGTAAIVFLCTALAQGSLLW